MRMMHILNSWRTHMLIVYFTQYGHSISTICRNHLRVLLIVWHILHMQIDMQTFHIILNILNMPKDSHNICDELKSTVVCRVNVKKGFIIQLNYSKNIYVIRGGRKFRGLTPQKIETYALRGCIVVN